MNVAEDPGRPDLLDRELTPVDAVRAAELERDGRCRGNVDRRQIGEGELALAVADDDVRDQHRRAGRILKRGDADRDSSSRGTVRQDQRAVQLACELVLQRGKEKLVCEVLLEA